MVLNGFILWAIQPTTLEVVASEGVVSFKWNTCELLIVLEFLIIQCGRYAILANAHNDTRCAKFVAHLEIVWSVRTGTLFDYRSQLLSSPVGYCALNSAMSSSSEAVESIHINMLY